MENRLNTGTCGHMYVYMYIYEWIYLNIKSTGKKRRGRSAVLIIDKIQK